MGGVINNVRYNTVEYIDRRGRRKWAGLDFAHGDTWRETVAIAEEHLRTFLGDDEVEVVMLNGNAR